MANKATLFIAVCLACLTCLTEAALAAGEPDALSKAQVFGRSLTRLHIANSGSFPRTATGLTQSLQLAAEKRLNPRLTVLGEVEAVYAVVGKFNDGTVANPTRPLIPDPETLELNRLQIQYDVGANSFLTLGRQVLAIDDQRFIGATPFRQNTQTFDGAHFSKRFGRRGVLQAGYFWRANRALGKNNVSGRLRGSSYFISGHIETAIGRIGGYHYALDLEARDGLILDSRASSVTTGVRIDGRAHGNQLGIDWEAAYAEQRDFADNPIDFKAQYWLARARLFVGETRYGFRTEVLGGGNDRAFQTPLASLRKFQGFANVFLVTPIDGVVDIETDFAWEAGTVGSIERLSLKASHHWFRAEQGSTRYGTELDLMVEGTYAGTVLSFGYAKYFASNFASDTSRIIFSVRRHF